MKNANLPANPCGEKWKQQSQYGGNYVECSRAPLFGGLTKREHFAGLAMQGLCNATCQDGTWCHDAKTVAKTAVEYADALLAELERTK